MWVQSVPWCEFWLQLIFSQLTGYTCNDNQPQQRVQIARKVHRDGTDSRASQEVKPVGKDQSQKQGSKRVALVNQQCGSGRDQEPEPFYKYQVKEGQALTAASHSTGLSLSISVIKICPEPRVPNPQEEGHVARSMTVKLLRLRTSC